MSSAHRSVKNLSKKVRKKVNLWLCPRLYISYNSNWCLIRFNEFNQTRIIRYSDEKKMMKNFFEKTMFELRAKNSGWRSDETWRPCENGFNFVDTLPIYYCCSEILAILTIILTTNKLSMFWCFADLWCHYLLRPGNFVFDKICKFFDKGG